MLASTILYDIQQRYGITCTLSAFFADPTIEGLLLSARTRRQ
ncbi:hypothetical protein DMI69_11715 [Escherichia coli]|nr:hypothetical protein [Escherichia coli]